MFAIPWHGHTVVSTTDTPIPEATLEPRAKGEEIDFILETAADLDRSHAFHRLNQFLDFLFGKTAQSLE